MDKQSAFRSLYGRHAAAVTAYVARRSNASSTDDVVAEVFVVCWRRFDELPEDPLPWLLGVARKVLSTHRRSEERRSALKRRLAHNATALAPTPPIGDGTLANALARLSEPDRELLMLIAWEGMTPTQAAVVLKAKPVTARVRLMRARRRLTEALAREEATTEACSDPSMEVSR